MAKVTHIHETERGRRPSSDGKVNGWSHSERRGSPRLPVAEAPAFAAQLVDGPAIEIVNVSQTGVLTRSAARLMPGAMIGLRILTADESFVLFGRVVRSRLLAIDEGTPRYESALALTQEFPLLAVTAASAASAPAGVAAPRDDGYPVEIGRLSGAPVVLTVTTFVDQRREDVMKALAVDKAR